MGIKVCDLVMEYKKGVKVLNHVNLTIEHGIYGLLGENGAGKTTLMKILVTLLTPTSGTVEINGLTVKPENYEIIKKQIGYLPQEFGLYPNLTVREALEYVGIMSGMEKAEYQKQIDYYLEATGLSAHQKKKNRQLSGGMKRRVGLIQALLHKLCTVDRYPSDSFVFSSHGYDLHIDNELVADAFADLPQQEQSILILYCVLDMADGEIASLTGMSRSAVQRHRTKTLKELRVKLMALMPEGG